MCNLTKAFISLLRFDYHFTYLLFCITYIIRNRDSSLKFQQQENKYHNIITGSQYETSTPPNSPSLFHPLASSGAATVAVPHTYHTRSVTRSSLRLAERNRSETGQRLHCKSIPTFFQTTNIQESGISTGTINSFLGKTP